MLGLLKFSIARIEVALVRVAEHQLLLCFVFPPCPVGDLTVELESLLFAAFMGDIDRGWLQRYPLDDVRFAEASNLIARYPEQPLRTLDALHLTLAAQAGIPMLATADAVMAETASLMGFAVERF